MTLRERTFSRMDELGIQPKRSLGQNFLVSDGVVEKIISAADAARFDACYEIGPGLGALTEHLAPVSQQLHVIEYDKKFASYWRERGLDVLEVDALKLDWPGTFKPQQKHILVSNLPYQISARLVVELSMLVATFDRMVLMFQKEVAQRIQAGAGSESYGLLSVVAQTRWNINKVCEVGPVDFFPRPNVASRVLCFDHRDQSAELGLGADFLQLLKQGFNHRRKKLQPQLGQWGDRTQILSIFEEIGANPQVRADGLSPEQWIKLYLSLKRE